MKYLSQNEINNKRILLRCDFNVPIKDGIIIDDSKIVKSLNTINYLLDNDNKVIILSHFGKVLTNDDKEKNSLYPVYEYLKEKIDLEFIPNPLELDKVLSSSKNKCFLVENTRFTDVPEKKESANDLELAYYWSTFADVFVLDAFASLHRSHSSTAGISKYLPTYLGFLVEKEITNLKPLIELNEHPFVVVMGGAKVDDKIKIIASMLDKCDKLILTGGILNTFLKIIGKNVGNSLVSKDEEVLQSVKDVLDRFANKIYFTDSFIVDRNKEKVKIKIDDIQDNDIIYDNIINIDGVLDNAKLIFMNGTCGKYEDKQYELGTIKLFQDLASRPNVYIGGGDTVAAVTKFKMEDCFKYLSSGGGATLEYIAYGKLKALEWINENSVDN